jgi:superfamily II DNA/RNA helicase
MLLSRRVVNLPLSRRPLHRLFALALAPRLLATGLFLSGAEEPWADFGSDLPGPDRDLLAEDFGAQLRRESCSLVLGPERRSAQVHLKALVNEITNCRPRESERLGALILSNSVEQSVELYRELKLLSAERGLKVSRLGSVSYAAAQVGVDADDRSLTEASRANLRKVAEDEQLDVLIATTGQLAHLSQSTRVFNPKILLVEDFELQFQNESSNEIDDILESVGLDTHIIWASRNQTPALPNYLTEWFTELDCVAQEVKVPAVSTRYFRVEKNNKLTKALELVRLNRDKKGVLVCRDPDQASLIRQVVSRLQVRNFLLTTSRRAPPRVWNLLSFKSSSSSLLITEPRAMKALDLGEADFVIFLDECRSLLEEYYAVRSFAHIGQVVKFIEF